jgi:hypothetical protein
MRQTAELSLRTFRIFLREFLSLQVARSRERTATSIWTRFCHVPDRRAVGGLAAIASNRVVLLQVIRRGVSTRSSGGRFG